MSEIASPEALNNLIKEIVHEQILVYLKSPRQLVAVRVPHNFSRRVLEGQTPIRKVGRWPGGGPDSFYSKTNAFFTFSVARSIKPMVFQQFRWPGVFQQFRWPDL